MPVEIRLLGDVELRSHGCPITVGRRQQRLILGILGLHANRFVTSDRLISLLWGGDPPPSARAAVQSRISELRSLFRVAGDESLQLRSQGSGYTLLIAPGNVDVDRFRHLIDDARVANDDEVKRAAFRDALSLWRGSVLGGLLSPEAYQEVAADLELARMAALEDLYDAELRDGEHHRIADEVVAAALAHPIRERLIGQMLTALHRAGRSSEALARYDRWRRWLRDELGVDPSAELQETHRAVLRGTAARPPRPAVAGMLPPDVADFTGRAGEVEALARVLGDGSVATVSGPAGSGKTALCVHVAHQLSSRFPDGALYATLNGVGDGDPVAAGEVLARFLAHLGVDRADLPESIEDRLVRYRELLAVRRVLIVLDNAADDDQIAPFVPGVSGCALVVNSRRRLGATLGARPLPLDVLTTVDAVALLKRVAGRSRMAAEADAVRRLAQLCGHLPLALRIAGARLAAKPHWTVERLATQLTDERLRLTKLAMGQLDVRASITLSYAALPGPVRELLCRLGDLDLPEVPVWLCAALLGTDCDTAEDALEQLFDAQLIDAAGPGPAAGTRYRLHDLVRLFARDRSAVDQDAPSLRAGRQRAFGAALTVLEAVNRDVGPAYQGVRGDSPRWPLDDRVRNQVAAEPFVWFDRDFPLLAALIRRAAQDDDVTYCWELASLVSPMMPVRRSYAEIEDVLGRALTATQQSGDRRGQAALHFRIGWHRAASEPLSRAAALFHEVGDEHGEALSTAVQGTVERFCGNSDVAMRRYRTALPGLRAAADLGGEAFALRGIGQLHTQRHEYVLAEQDFSRALTLYRTIGARQGIAQVLFWQAVLRMDQQRWREAREGFQDALVESRALGDRSGEAQCLRGLGLWHQRRQQPAQAMEMFTAALDIVVRHPGASYIEAQIRWAMGQCPPATATSGSAVTAYGLGPVPEGAGPR